MIPMKKRRIRLVVQVISSKLQEWSTLRFRLLIWSISGIVEPIVWSVLWLAVSREGGGGMRLGSAEILTYYACIAIVSRLVQSWTYDDLKREIFEGTYSKYLLWPSSMVLYRFAMDLGNKLLNLMITLPIGALWLLILYQNDMLRLDIQWLFHALFALGGGIVLKFSLDVAIAHVGLWISRSDGIGLLYNFILRLCGGVVVPLLLLPGSIRELFNVLPFRYVLSFPVEIITGSLSRSEMISGYAILFVWVFIVFFLLEVLLRKGLPRYEATGL